MKILANDGISSTGKELLEQTGHLVITNTVEQANLVDYINKENIEILLVRSATTVRKDMIDACPSLKMVGRGGVGMDNIDVAYGREKGLFVFNTPASSSQSVAELVFAHLFGMTRFVYDSNRKMPQTGLTEFKTLKKAYGKGTELRGKTLGLIGLGRIGLATAKYAMGIGMKVIASDPFVPQAFVKMEIGGENLKLVIDTVSMGEVLAKSDFISLHVPKQADGSAVIKTAEILKMKDGVMLINLSRGGVIEETALLEGLNSGKVAAAALDVFENEPTPMEALLLHPKISLTPHIGAATVEAQDRIGEKLQK